MTIPVNLDGFLKKTIADISTSGDWKEKYRSQIYNAYSKHPYSQEQMPWIEEMLKLSTQKLMDYNLFAMRTLFEILGITTPIVFSSEMQIRTTKTQRLYDICRKCEAKAYLAGQGAIDYLDPAVFGDDIRIIKHEFSHPRYGQKNQSSFVSHLSIIDFLMNVGTQKTKEFLDGQPHFMHSIK